MTRTDRHRLREFRPGDRIAIIAGSGKLPVDVAGSLAASGNRPFVVMSRGEADPSLAEFEHEIMGIEQFASLVPTLKKKRVTHVVLAGGIESRPRLGALRPTPGLLMLLPRLIRAIGRGDDGVLRAVVALIEANGMEVVGAHEIVPDLLATEGRIAGPTPLRRDWPDMNAALAAALAIGALDVGQGAVAIGGRVIALEGIEGTDGMLARVKDLRSHGRLAGRKRGVLVKCAKPGQEYRADLPAIGPETIAGAYSAGLAGVAVEAGRSLILDYGGVVEGADRHGVFVFGLKPATSP